MSSQSTAKLTVEDVSRLTLLLSIINNGDWQGLAYSILNNPTKFVAFCHKLTRCPELNGMSILHATFRNNPPQTIVKLLLKLVPEAAQCVDCLGRLPLHIATGTRADLVSIQLLATAYPQGCCAQDSDGKTPLHMACDTQCELFESGDDDSSDTELSPPSLEVVKILIKANPSCVQLEDQDGMSALEHAIFSDSDLKVVKFLQYCTRVQCSQMAASTHDQENKKKSREDVDMQDVSMNEEQSSRVQQFSSRRISQDSTDHHYNQPMMIDNEDSDEDEAMQCAVTHANVIPALKDEFTSVQDSLMLTPPGSKRRRGGFVSVTSMHSALDIQATTTHARSA